MKAAVRGLAKRTHARRIQRAARDRKRPRKGSSPGALQILTTSVVRILVWGPSRKEPWSQLSATGHREAPKMRLWGTKNPSGCLSGIYPWWSACRVERRKERAKRGKNDRERVRTGPRVPAVDAEARRAAGDVGKGQNGLACTALFRRWQTTQAPSNAARGLAESAHAWRVYRAAQDLKRSTGSLRPVHLKKLYCGSQYNFSVRRPGHGPAPRVAPGTPRARPGGPGVRGGRRGA